MKKSIGLNIETTIPFIMNTKPILVVVCLLISLMFISNNVNANYSSIPDINSDSSIANANNGTPIYINIFIF